jgi:hypothetical protein
MLPLVIFSMNICSNLYVRLYANELQLQLNPDNLPSNLVLGRETNSIRSIVFEDVSMVVGIILLQLIPDHEYRIQ